MIGTERMKPVKPTVMRGLISIPISVIVPPLAVFLTRGKSMHFFASLALFTLAVVIFVFLYAGIGVLLYMLAMVHGLILTVWTLLVSWPRE